MFSEFGCRDAEKKGSRTVRKKGDTARAGTSRIVCWSLQIKGTGSGLSPRSHEREDSTVENNKKGGMEE